MDLKRFTRKIALFILTKYNGVSTSIEELLISHGNEALSKLSACITPEMCYQFGTNQSQEIAVGRHNPWTQHV